LPSSGSTSSAPTPTPADPAAKARDIFKSQCAVCHGESGKGDGVGAASLEPKPRNYTDKAWQTSTDDARIKKVILEGGAANGLNAAMPPYAAQIDGPVADELVKIIRGFGA
jgi:mono/diheme cytochrome c family protein